MSILDELGLDAKSFEWQDLAICRSYPINSSIQDIFFDAYEKSPEIAKATDEMCLSCPVIKHCQAMGKNETGVFGGVYYTNGRPDISKNSHKTPEVWKKIANRLHS